MRKLWLLLFFGIATLTACAVEDSALPKQAITPVFKTYVINYVRHNSDKSPIVKREFRFTLKADNNKGAITGELNELLGMSNSSSFIQNSNTLTYNETDTKDAAFSFDNPMQIEAYPIEIGKSWDIKSKASWAKQSTGQIVELSVTGTAQNDHVGERSIHGRSVRVIVLKINIKVDTDTKIVTGIDQSSDTLTAQHFENKYIGELWYAPSFGLIVGGEYEESHSGDKAHADFDGKTKWSIANLGE